MANNRELSQFASFVSADSGRVGINTDTFPDARDSFIVAPPSGQTDVFFTIKTLSTNGNTRLQFSDPDDTNVGDISYTHSNNAMVFKTADTERLRIDSAGRMLLGTTTVPTGLVLGNSLTAASSTGAEVVTFRSDTSVAVGDKCGAFVIGNSDTDGVEDHFVGMWGKVASTNGSMDLHFAAGRSSYEGDTPDVTIKSGGDVGINTTSNNDGAHFQHYQSEVRHQSFQSTNGDLAIVTDNNSNPAAYIKGTGTADLLKVVDNSTTVFLVEDGGRATFDVGAPNSSDKVIARFQAETSRRLDAVWHDSGSLLGFNTVDSHSMIFKTGGTERLRILSNGNGVQIMPNSSGDIRLQFGGNGTRLHNTTAGGHIDLYTNNAVRNRFLYNGQGTEFSNQNRVIPTTDNAVDLGASGARWDDVYATNGTIQTSDSRLKREVETSVLGIDFVKALRPVSYKWIESKKIPIVDGTDENGDNTYRTDADGNWVYESRDGARRHWGFIAQEVKQAVDDASVDFAGWSLADKDDSNSTQSLRYEEFISPLTKALQEAIAKIETLETQNADLLARVTALEGS
jgi:hypothetical protein